MALPDVSKTEQSCRACKMLRWVIPGVSPVENIEVAFDGDMSVPDCTCNVIDFVHELCLDDSRGMHDRIPQLHSGEYVELGSMFFRITGDDPRTRVGRADTDPEAAAALLRSMGFTDVEIDDVEDPAMIRRQLIAAGLPSEVVDENTITKDEYESGGYADFLAWADVLPADATTRYLPVGTQHEAIVAPFLYTHGCSRGINRLSGIAFSRYIEAERDSVKVAKLAKELWGNDVVKNAVETGEPLTVCADCGFPMPRARLELSRMVMGGKLNYPETHPKHGMHEWHTVGGYDYCVWCSEEREESAGQIHLRYYDLARAELYRSEAAARVVAIPSLNATPMAMAAGLNLKLSAFFRKTKAAASWMAHAAAAVS